MLTATTNFQAALAAYRYGPIIQLITIAGYSRAFTNYATGVVGQYDWLVSIDDFQQYSIHDLQGGADLSNLCFSVQDLGGAVTGDFPGFVFEGKQVTVKIGFPGLAQVDFCTIFTGYIDTVSNQNSNTEYYFSCSDFSSRLAQPVYVAGDDGLPTDSSNPKTVIGHPLDILTDILINKLGIPSGNVDLTKIDAYRDGIFAGAQFQFNITSPPQADEFIKKQLLMPLGGYLWVNAAGLITVNFFYPINGVTSVGTLGPASWTSIPDAEQVDMVNTVQFQFDKDDGSGGTGNKYLAVDTEIFAASTAKYGQYGMVTIPADGMRSAFQGFFLSKLVARMIFYRYGLKNLTFSDQSSGSVPDSIWSTLRYEPGDVVTVTHPKVPDRQAGTIGITGKLFEIVNKKINFQQGTLTYTMIDASYLTTFGTFLIAPTGEARYPAAPAAPSLATVAGGSLGSATEFYRLTYNTASGETLAGGEASIVRGANTVVRITSPQASSNVVSYNVYGGSTSGSETKQNGSPILIGVNWTEPTTGLVSGAAMPGSDTSASASLADKPKYMFMCNDSDKYSNNDPAHVLG